MHRYRLAETSPPPVLLKLANSLPCFLQAWGCVQKLEDRTFGNVHLILLYALVGMLGEIMRVASRRAAAEATTFTIITIESR